MRPSGESTGRDVWEGPKTFVYRYAPPQVELNCHLALTVLTKGQGSLKAHPVRKQAGGKMLSFAPPCSILSGTQPLSGRWRMIPSFCPVSCSRCGRSFIAPGPRGHICPQCQKERRMNREKTSARGVQKAPRAADGGAFLQTRGTGACAGAACGITLAGYAGPGDPGHLPAHASDCLTSPLR